MIYEELAKVYFPELIAYLQEKEDIGIIRDCSLGGSPHFGIGSVIITLRTSKRVLKQVILPAIAYWVQIQHVEAYKGTKNGWYIRIKEKP